MKDGWDCGSTSGNAVCHRVWGPPNSDQTPQSYDLLYLKMNRVTTITCPATKRRTAWRYAKIAAVLRKYILMVVGRAEWQPTIRREKMWSGTWGVPQTEFNALLLQLQTGGVVLKHRGHVGLEDNKQHGAISGETYVCQLKITDLALKQTTTFTYILH